MAKTEGLDPNKVIKHFGTPDTPLTPSLVAKHELFRSYVDNNGNLPWRAITWMKTADPEQLSDQNRFHVLP